jgi:SAM-dependent methyltransferase
MTVAPEKWIACGDGLQKRIYQSYEQYTAHQEEKLRTIDLREYDVKFSEALLSRLGDLCLSGKTVLCLGARLGTEVRAFIQLGCFAVGVDLNPGPKNQHVLYGDFHNLQFAPSSVDVVYTNSLDHVYSFERVLSQIKQVLKRNGLLILEAVRGSEEGVQSGAYESFWWSKIDHLVSEFEKAGFKLLERRPFTYPWPGEQLCLKAP